jgi:phospholipid/cholesterol/gamma-HCH transport system substrate-binding protein
VEAARDRNRNILVGAFVLLAVGLFGIGVLQSSAVREWLNPSKNLRLLLPDEGLFGLIRGAKIEILGTPAGTVTEIVIDPNQKIHAQARIEPAMAPFVRRDSKAIIRKTFGVAGETFVEITRGRGEPMDWDYAVLSAEADRAPTESIGEMMADVRNRVMPILAQTERAITALASLTERLADPQGSLQVMLRDVSALTARLERGQGSLGRMLADDAAARDLEALLSNANDTVTALRPILDDIRATARQTALLSETINAQSKDLPQINAKVNAILASLERIMGDLSRTSPELPKITRDVSATTASAPVLIGTLQQTLTELELLLRQLRGHWLLGGGGGDQPPAATRLPPREVRP